MRIAAGEACVEADRARPGAGAPDRERTTRGEGRRTPWKARTAAALAAVAVGLVCVGTGAGTARAITLIDDNSLVEIDPTRPNGLSDWNVNGIDHLSQQWYWFRIGDAGPESSLDTLARTSSVLSDTDADGDDDTWFALFEHELFRLEIRWILEGGPLAGPAAGATADLATQITLTNTSNGALSLHLFQYSDVDLLGSPGDDRVEFPGSGPTHVVDILDASALAEYQAVFTPAAVPEAALFGTTLASLNDGGPTAFSGPASAGPGDTTWAIEWGFALPVDGAASISQDQRIRVAPLAVPEPGAAVLVAAGLGALGAGRRRERAGRTLALEGNRGPRAS